jgi:hypothetical protein
MFVFDPGGGTGVSTTFPGPVNTFVPAPESSGTLRFVRVGTTLTAYRLTPGGWSALQSTSEAGSDVVVVLDVFSNAPQFSHPDARAPYDNFRLNAAPSRARRGGKTAQRTGSRCPENAISRGKAAAYPGFPLAITTDERSRQAHRSAGLGDWKGTAGIFGGRTSSRGSVGQVAFRRPLAVSGHSSLSRGGVVSAAVPTTPQKMSRTMRLRATNPDRKPSLRARERLWGATAANLPRAALGSFRAAPQAQDPGRSRSRVRRG